MSREDLIEHILSQMRDPDTEVDNRTTLDGILCQNCGTRISHEYESEGVEFEDYVIHRIPEHGSQEMTSVFYCGRICFQKSMDKLFDHDDDKLANY